MSGNQNKYLKDAKTVRGKAAELMRIIAVGNSLWVHPNYKPTIMSPVGLWTTIYKPQVWHYITAILFLEL